MKLFFFFVYSKILLRKLNVNGRKYSWLKESTIVETHFREHLGCVTQIPRVAYAFFFAHAASPRFLSHTDPPSGKVRYLHVIDLHVSFT